MFSNHTASQFSTASGILSQGRETVLLRLKKCNYAATLLHYCVFVLGNNRLKMIITLSSNRLLDKYHYGSKISPLNLNYQLVAILNLLDSLQLRSFNGLTVNDLIFGNSTAEIIFCCDLRKKNDGQVCYDSRLKFVGFYAQRLNYHAVLR